MESLFDDFSFNIDCQAQSYTKRTILSEMYRIYDPLGFLTHVTLHLKLLFQKLCAVLIGWDKNVPSQVSDSWSEMHAQVSVLKSVSIPRIIDVNLHSQIIELHGFWHASREMATCVSLISERLLIQISILSSDAHLTFTS